jgi:S1-C subfamily serine protease
MALAAMVSQKTPSKAAPEPLSKMKFEFYPENTESESDRKIKELIRESGMIGSSEEIAKEVIPATVTIYSKKKDGSSSQGSGFHIGDGDIVTNYHVIEKSIEILVKFSGSEELHEVDTIVFVDSDNDIAVLGIVETNGPSISKYNFELPSIGSEVYASGTPKGLESTFSNGIVSAIREDTGFNRIQITAPVSPGSSGGPVVDSSGACIGIAFGSIKNGQNLNFAIPISYLRDGLRSVEN